MTSEKTNKVLIFTDWYLPGYKAGGPIQSIVNMVERLRQYCEIYIVTGDHDLGCSEPYSNVTPNECLILSDNVKIIYISHKKMSIKYIASIIKEYKCDCIYLNSMYSYYFSIIPLLLHKYLIRDTRIVLAPRGMLGNSALNSKVYKKQIYLKLFKALNIFHLVIFQATSEEERKNIRQNINVKTNVMLIPNLLKLVPEKVFRINKSKGCIKLIFLSLIVYMKNLQYFLEILPELKGEIIFDIYGPVQDESYWENCKRSIERIESDSDLNQRITINYKGSLPNNEVLQNISDHHFFILPTLGENFGHAIFEAMSAGRPVVISDRTPWRNLEKSGAGWDISLEDKEAWVCTLQKCIDMEQEKYDKLSMSTYSYAKQYAEQPEIIEKYRELFSADS